MAYVAATGSDSRATRVLHWFTSALFLFACSIVLGAEPAKSTNNIPARTNNAPQPHSAPTLSPYLASFQTKTGFRVEQVAAAPLVVCPVAMAFDENGRLFVAEMSDFPDRRNETPHLGRIRRLVDSDGDGVFDTSTVYADNLAWPSAVTCSDGGVYVGVTPDILYLKDSTGDGVADIRKAVFTGFGGTNTVNIRNLLNSFQWGPDNLIHGGASDLGGVIIPLAVQNTPSLPIADNDFAFDTRTSLIGLDTGSAQSGLSFDNRGRKFVTDFVHPLRLAMLEPRYLLRYPFFPKPPVMLDVTRYPARIFQPPPGQTELTRLTALAPGIFANARGSAVYRGDAFPSTFLENIFIADPAAHIVHRAILREDGLTVRAERAGDDQNSEFLVSKDPLFQPMQVINAPDGTLYIADLHGGENEGRIIRVVPQNFRSVKPPQLGSARTFDLVATLANTNGWHRDTAARLLYERQDRAAIVLLTNMLKNARLPLARMSALRSLDGLGGLNETLVLKGLQDPDERVRDVAVRLSERLINKGVISDGLWNQLRSLTTDSSARVRFQLTLTLGDVSRSLQPQVLAELIRRDFDSPWMQSAALSSLSQGSGNFFLSLASNPRILNSPVGRGLLYQVAAIIGLHGEEIDARQVVAFVEQRDDLAQEFAFNLLGALGEGLQRSHSSLSLMDPTGGLQGFYLAALDAAGGGGLSDPLRLASLRLLSVSSFTYTDIGDYLLLMLGSGASYAIQSATLNTLAGIDDPRVFTNIIARWDLLTPPVRSEAVAALLTRGYRFASMLSAIESGYVRPTDVASPQINLLRTDRDPKISQRALRIFGPVILQHPEQIERFQPALRLTGSPARGREIYTARCASCHQIAGTGIAVGQNLDAARIMGKQKLLSDIVQPNANISPQFTTSVVETKNHEILIGIIRDDNTKTLTIRRPSGRDIVLLQNEIDSSLPQPWSVMPEGLAQDLSSQDMADLLEYLVAPNR